MLRLALVLASLGPFRGCGEDPPSSGPLPVSDASICRSDDDCRAGTCEDIRCIGGACVVSTVGVLDDDADGFGPGMMCGGDCDDRDPGVRPGAFETCDARDEDCDGLVDEDAVSRTVNGDFPGVSPSTVIAAWGATTHPFIAIEPSLGGVFGRTIDLFGRGRPAVELLRLARGSRYERIHAVANDELQVLIVARTDLGAVQYAVFEADEIGLPEAVVPPTFLELDGQASATDIVYAGSGWLLAADVAPFDESPQRRVVFDDLAAPPLYDRPRTDDAAPLSVAWLPPRGFAVTDGNTLVFDTGERVDAGTPGNGLAATQDGAIIGRFTNGTREGVMQVSADGTIVDLSDRIGSSTGSRISRLGEFIAVTQGGANDVRFYDASGLATLGNIRSLAAETFVAASGRHMAAMAASASGGTSVTILARCE